MSNVYVQLFTFYLNRGRNKRAGGNGDSNAHSASYGGGDSPHGDITGIDCSKTALYELGSAGWSVL